MKNSYDIQGDVTAIFLNRRDGTTIETHIDTIDLPKAKEFPNSWIARWDPKSRKYYTTGIMSVNNKRKSIQFTRWLLHVEGKLVVDHYDHNTLNNRKSNLRIVTHAQNMQNRSPEITSQYSKLRGVTFDKRNQKWHASLNHNGRRHFFGYFDTMEKADVAVKKGRAVLFPYSTDALEVQTDDTTNIYPDKTLPLGNKLHKAPRGIYWYKKLRKWHVMIQHKHVRHKFGFYATLEEATMVAKEKRKELCG